jgi:hypothetical protein
MPQETVVENLQVKLPTTVIPGEYSIELGLQEQGAKATRPVRLAFRPSLHAPEEFYRIGTLQVQ